MLRELLLRHIPVRPVRDMFGDLQTEYPFGKNQQGAVSSGAIA